MLDRVANAELEPEPNPSPGAVRTRRWREKKGTAGNPAPAHENINQFNDDIDDGAAFAAPVSGCAEPETPSRPTAAGQAHGRAQAWGYHRGDQARPAWALDCPNEYASLALPFGRDGHAAARVHRGYGRCARLWQPTMPVVCKIHIYRSRTAIPYARKSLHSGSDHCGDADVKSGSTYYRFGRDW